MSDPSMYQFQLDWDFPAAGFARTYAYRGGSAACSRAGARSRMFWLLVGAGMTYWWMRSSQQRKLIKDAERKRARKDRKAAKEEWVLRLSREVVDDESDDEHVERVELARVKTRKNLGAEASETLTDVLEVALDSINLAVNNLKGKIAQRRETRDPSGDFSSISVQEAQATA
ncbi:hypothetical protein EXIGLDRAFT_761566 [Exidia glandulosa HHB12029]|uniref:Uncharacterized protein n=1 Tax=Exidia glandulosa HHB12029 TaxID=1314781 RepID=A0A165NAS6_EXIGL|nr:hypothetical protein EXIGLDRAFT_761566 [Exidia glandulosa HHB12029]